MSALKDRLTTLLDSRASRQILRSLSPSPIETPLVDFSSNDYLSFSHSPLLKQKLLRSLLATPPNESPYGPPSSRLLDGNTTQHLLLEDRLAAFFCGDAGLLFNSGFDANVGIWTCLPDKNDIVLYDKLIHASTHDGMRASRVPAKDRRSFEHNSVEDLERLLLDCCEEEGVKEGLRSVWVTTETLFSMDGDLAPLKEIVECVERCLPRGNGHLVVDEVGRILPLRCFALLIVFVTRHIRLDCMVRMGGVSYAHWDWQIESPFEFTLSAKRWLVQEVSRSSHHSHDIADVLRCSDCTVQPPDSIVSHQLRSTVDLFDGDAVYERSGHRELSRNAGTRSRSRSTSFYSTSRIFLISFRDSERLTSINSPPSSSRFSHHYSHRQPAHSHSHQHSRKPLLRPHRSQQQNPSSPPCSSPRQ